MGIQDLEDTGQWGAGECGHSSNDSTGTHVPPLNTPNSSFLRLTALTHVAANFTALTHVAVNFTTLTHVAANFGFVYFSGDEG